MHSKQAFARRLQAECGPQQRPTKFYMAQEAIMTSRPSHVSLLIGIWQDKKLVRTRVVQKYGWAKRKSQTHLGLH